MRDTEIESIHISYKEDIAKKEREKSNIKSKLEEA